MPDHSLVEGEHLVLKVHPHWKTVLRPLSLLVLIVVVALVVVLLLPSGSAYNVLRIVIGVLAVVGIAILSGVPLIRWRTTTYELTTRRLRLRSGILSRQGRDFPLNRISDVSFSHGFIDRLLGCGKLTVESPGEHGQLVLTEIPEVEKVQATLFQLVEDEQQRMAKEEH